MGFALEHSFGEYCGLLYNRSGIRGVQRAVVESAVADGTYGGVLRGIDDVFGVRLRDFRDGCRRAAVGSGGIYGAVGGSGCFGLMDRV